MRALIRNPSEIILETDSIEGIDWNTGAPLTNPEWRGGAYAICENVPDHAIMFLDIDQRTNINNYRVEAYDDKGRTKYRATWMWS